MRAARALLIIGLVTGIVSEPSLKSLVLSAAQSPSSRPVRVLLAAPRDQATLRAGSAWQLLDKDRRVIARGMPDEEWLIERQGKQVRATSPLNRNSDWYDGEATLVLSDTSALSVWNGKRYRGTLVFAPVDTSLFMVNKVDVEDYLRGVVPLESGIAAPSDHAAVEAQAVAARSFTYTRMIDAISRPFDLTASASDQVYGGVAVENFIGDLAVAATAGWVLAVNGRVVSAPYHSTCGGSTAAPSEVWSGQESSWLTGVSDRIPGTDRYYCEISPRFRWERSLEGDALAASIDRYARAYTRGVAAGVVRSVTVDRTTASGRAERVAIVTEHTRFTVGGNDARSVLRPVGGGLLPSAYFSLEPVIASGRMVRIVIRGQGNGHGVGMCQWGAIGRARAGQDFRAILRAYYPAAQLVRAP